VARTHLQIGCSDVRIDNAHTRVVARGTGVGVLRYREYWAFKVGAFSIPLLVPVSSGPIVFTFFGLFGVTRVVVQLGATHRIEEASMPRTRLRRIGLVRKSPSVKPRQIRGPQLQLAQIGPRVSRRKLTIPHSTET
jgi:hypothetical protein